jgi:class 3 adenylate cyclase
MFLDRHDGVKATPDELAAAHVQDLSIENEYGVHYHTYWFDPEAETVFCLASGPSEEAVDAVHLNSHGLGATTIIEIDPNVPLNQMFGHIPLFPSGTPYTASAIRTILFTDICGSVAQTELLGDDAAVAMVQEHDAIVRAALEARGGHEVKHTGDGIMASFASVAAGVACAVDVQRDLHTRNQAAEVPLHVSIGMSAGEPVTNDNDDLFGAVVQLAARLCAAASEGDIYVSVAVRELCMGKPFRFGDQGRLAMKGMTEPMQTYAVLWRDQ